MMKNSKVYTHTAILLLIFALSWGCAPKRMETSKLDNVRNVVERVEPRQIDGVTRITIAAKDPISYTTFKLVDPVRVVIDINEADLSGLEKTIPVNSGAIDTIVLTQFGEDELNIGRVEILLNELTDYNIEKDTNVLTVDIQTLAVDKSEGQPALEEVMESAPVEGGARVKAPKRVYANKAKYIADLAVEKRDNGIDVIITGDGYIGDNNTFTIPNPARIVTDVIGVKNLFRKNSLHVNSPLLKSVRVGQHPDKVRLVLDIPDGASSRFITRKSENRLILTLGEPAVAEAPEEEVTVAEPPEVVIAPMEEVAVAAEVPMAAATAAPPEEKAAPEIEAPAQPVEKKESPLVKASKIANVTGVDFGQRPDFSRVTISSDSDYLYEIRSSTDEKLAFDILGARVPKNLQRSLDTSEFDSPIQLISSYQLKKGKENVVRVLILLKEAAPHEFTKEGDRLYIDFRRGAKEEAAPKEVIAEVLEEPEVPAPAAVEEAVVEKAGKAPLEETRVEVEIEGEGKKYVGQHVSLDYKDAEIGNILRLFAEISNLNIISTEDVKGTVTIKLDNVPWDQAMDIVLEAKGLGMTRIGNVIRIAPAAKLKQEEDADLARKKAMAKLEDLVVEIIPVNYADAADMSSKIKDTLSERGNVTVDSRTNVLIVKDIDKKVKQAGELVKLLDRAAPQVLIEARIVEIDTNYSRDLGVQWGSGYSADAAHGNPTGMSFPNSIGVGIGAGGGWSLDPPRIGASVGSGTGTGTKGDAGAAIGFNFGSIDNTFSLDLKLSALESRGVSKVISRPRIVTMDNSEAIIEQGFSIPFETTSADGTKTEFIDANLNLTVTPHITADGSVIMKLKVAKNEPDFARQGAGGKPSIIKKEASTEVLIADGDTTVIGGIFTQKKGNSDAGVPFFSKLPLIGWLFRSQSKVDDKAELLVFVTPRILKEKR